MVWRVPNYFGACCFNHSERLIMFSDELLQFFSTKYFIIETWKWFGLVATVFIVLTANKVMRSLLVRFKKQLLKIKDNHFIQYLLQQKIERALSWIIASVLGMILIESLGLTPNMEKYLLILLKINLSLHLIRFAYYAADASGLLIQNWTSKNNQQMNDQIAPLATKTLKVFVIIVGTLIVLQNFGVNVTALLAGLGLGGVALAFAAQDTVANIFGTITILLDSPFKIGDRVRILDVDGIIDEIGFRSTRIKTLTNSVVSIPNSVVAKEKIDNLSEREGIFRFRHVFGFTYKTPMTHILGFCENTKYYLQQEPNIIQDRTVVYITEFAASSINVTVNFHVSFNDPIDEFNLNQKYLVDFHKLAELQKAEFAFPTTTVIIDKSEF